MTIEQWLSDVYYDEWGTHIWNKVDKDGASQLVAEVRGWGAIQNEFKTKEEAELFQDEVGKFIVEAIREKITRLPQQEISDKEIEKASYDFWNFNEHTASTAWKLGAKWYKEQLKSKGNENKSNSSI